MKEVFCIYNDLDIGDIHTDAIIKVEFSLYHWEERDFARNSAWNTRIADKNLFLLDK